MLRAEYTAPTGPGRPRQLTGLELKIEQFADGVHNYFDSLAGKTPFYFLLNARVDGRALVPRNGYEIVDAAANSNGLLLTTFRPINDSPKLMRILGGTTQTVQLYDGSAWNSIGSFGTSSDNIPFTAVQTIINGEARTYFTNGNSTLRYTNGTNIVDVTDGTDPVIGKYIANIENILLLGNLGGSFSANQVIWSKAGTHTFRKDTDTSLSDTSNLITMDSQVIGLATLGWNAYIFTEYHGLWQLDMSTILPRRITSHTAVNNKVIATGYDSMIWAGYDGIYMLQYGKKLVRVSDPIKRILDACITDKSNWNAIITNDGKYKLYIGNIEWDGSVYSDVVVILDIPLTEQLKYPVWRIDSNKPSIAWTNWLYNNKVNEYFMTQDGTVYKDETGNTDNGQAINMVMQTKDFVIGDMNIEATPMKLWFKIMPDNTEDIDIVIKIRANKQDWQTINSFTLLHGNSLKLIHVPTKQGIHGLSVGILLSTVGRAKFQIYDMIMQYALHNTNIRPVKDKI